MTVRARRSASTSRSTPNPAKRSKSAGATGAATTRSTSSYSAASTSTAAGATDCGWRDQYHIHYGACILSQRLAEAGVRHRYEEFLRAADLEAKYAEYGGYTAEARAGELLLGLGVPTAQHEGPMSAVAPGWKLRLT